MPTGLVDLAQHFRFAEGRFGVKEPRLGGRDRNADLRCRFLQANGLGAYETQEPAESGDLDPQLRLEEIFPALALHTVFRDLGKGPIFPTASRLHLDYVQKVHPNCASFEGSSARN